MTISSLHYSDFNPKNIYLYLYSCVIPRWNYCLNITDTEAMKSYGFKRTSSVQEKKDLLKMRTLHTLTKIIQA